MKNYLFITFLSFILVSCGQKTGEIPEEVLTPDKMVEVLIDLQLLEGYFSQQNLPRDSAGPLFNRYEKELFQKHQIADSTYRNSFKFYSRHPPLMDKIYERVVDSLSLREGQKRL